MKNSIENARKILLKASEKYDVIMIGMPSIDDEEQNKVIKELDTKYQVLCNELNIPYLSIYEKLANDKIWKSEVSSNDGAHPKDKGYELLASFIKKWNSWWFKD